MTQVDIFDNAGGYFDEVILMTCVGYLDEMCYRLANMVGETASGRASQKRNIGSRQPGKKYWVAPAWK